ncbi:MAG: hypothetical protein KAT28_00665 [Candidatus Aenigmarchaeota archaeon]|nr:hypothetical protein [Candidatus Aenigmarchaeota archaeon]
MATQQEIIDLVKKDYPAEIYREYSNPSTYIKMKGVDISLYPKLVLLNSGLNILYENIIGTHLKHPKTVEPDTNLEVKKIEVEAPVNYRVFVNKELYLKEFLSLKADERNLYPVNYLDGEIIDLKKEEFDEGKFLEIVNSFRKMGEIIDKLEEGKEEERARTEQSARGYYLEQYKSWLE